jgi:VWFA-related protein
MFAIVSVLAAMAASSSEFPLSSQIAKSAAPHAVLRVDFAAVQADGTPVADLQASDVEVRLNGRTRKVISLRRIETSPAPPASDDIPRVPPPYGTNVGAAIGRSIALVIDEESFVGGREQPLRNAVDGLLGELEPSDRVMLVALPHGGVKASFTSAHEMIRRALAGMSGQGSRTETGSELAFRTRRFLDSLVTFLQPQAGRSTPLTAILFTGGLAPGMNELRTDHFQHVAAAAGAARATFYVVQPVDVDMRAAGVNESIGGVGFLGSDNPMEGIEHLAGVTGAARLPLDATGKGALLRIARETSTYYVAEIEPEEGEIYGRSRPLAVRVTRPGIAVRTRTEMTFVDRGQQAGTTQPAIAAVLSSTEPCVDLPLRVSGFPVRAAGAQVRVIVMAETVDPAVSLSSIGAILFDGTGRVAGQWLAKDATARPILGAMAAQAGIYRLRVGAIDSMGRSGVAEDVVDTRPKSVGPLLLGSLVFGISRDGGTRLQLEFGNEPAAIASFDIYGGTAGMGLTATLELARDAEGPSFLTLPLTLSRANEERVMATGTVPIGALAAGDYVVRGIVRLEDGSTGRVIRTLRKVGPTKPGGE